MVRFRERLNVCLRVVLIVATPIFSANLHSLHSQQAQQLFEIDDIPGLDLALISSMKNPNLPPWMFSNTQFNYELKKDPDNTAVFNGLDSDILPSALQMAVEKEGNEGGENPVNFYQNSYRDSFKTGHHFQQDKSSKTSSSYGWSPPERDFNVHIIGRQHEEWEPLSIDIAAVDNNLDHSLVKDHLGNYIPNSECDEDDRHDLRHEI